MSGKADGGLRGRRELFAVVATGLLLLATVGVYAAEFGPGSENLPPFGEIQHVVILLMENHAFDNYFGVCCPSVGPHCSTPVNGVPAGACLPRSLSGTPAGCERPFNFTAQNLSSCDLSHDWNSSHTAYDGGRMDGFIPASGGTDCTLGHYNGSTLPVYWDLAEEFGLADDFFSSALSYSLPNHWYLVAAQAPPVSENHVLLSASVSIHHEYLDQSNATPTVEQELDAQPLLSWKYYEQGLPSYSSAIQIAGHGAMYDGAAYDYWNALAGKYQSYSQTQHFAATAQFFRDVTSHTLPAISWVVPGSNESDHPPANVTLGQDFVATLVNTVESSSYWPNTAVFVLWDDYGGFYDNVAPPSLDQDGLSFRVPLLVVSPWTAPGSVDGSELYFESLLHLVEVRWNLGCLTTRDCQAPLPTGLFDFSLHRSPVYMPSFANASYPFQPAAPGAAPYVGPPTLETSWIANATVED